ncbi:glycosyltransferase [Chitinophaga horti]|uniref:Glycosyltransferase n=1 Tax=Chitinophaga horti TaxID=2920382 RepID=A0ABY6J6P1_9BACT|nr:nucleotide disphospho-sugar-binding domain-containing protein [Chitinophaga horti]UYQ95041.1 glycosyltransferase [Chitinophaga horti]
MLMPLPAISSNFVVMTQATPSPQILFAHTPLDSHLYPMTGLAMHLLGKGYDVQWYSSADHAEHIQALGIPVHVFTSAPGTVRHNSDERLPKRKRRRTKTAKPKFDLERYIERTPAYYKELQTLREIFPFDMLICDTSFTAGCLIKELMGVPVIAIGVMPLITSSRDLAPAGMGLTPPANAVERIKYAALRFFARHVTFARARKLVNRIFADHGMPPIDGLVADALAKKCDLLLQNGTPDFEYPRSDIGNNVKFIGALLPHRKTTPFADAARLSLYGKVILVTQGTLDNDPEKLLVPALEAFKNSPYMVVATTGSFNTERLRERFPQKNILITDDIDFDQVMPMVDVFVSNGGYGGVMQAIKYQLPMVVAGVQEGRNEVSARVAYFKLGVNLAIETPSASQVRTAVEKVLSDGCYVRNVNRLALQFRQYDAGRAAACYVQALLHMYQRKREGAQRVF